MKLKTAEVQAFQREGYLKIPYRVIEEEHLQRLRGSYDQVFKGEDVRNLSQTESTNEEAIETTDEKMWKVGGMWKRSEDFWHLVYHKPLLEIVESLIDGSVQLYGDEALYKPAYSGGAIPW